MHLGGVVAVWALSLVASRAAAQPSARCTTVTLSGTTPDEARWQSAVAALERVVAGLGECPTLALEWAPAHGGASLVLRAVAPGGLETARVVTEPDALVPIALGLLAGAPHEPSSPRGASGPAAASRSEAAADEPPRSSPVEPRATSPIASALPFGATIALTGGARVTGPTLFWMLDLELRADVRIRDWIVLLNFRYAPVGASPGNVALDDDSYNEVAVGVGIGRRFALGGAAIDLALTPSLVTVGMESDFPADNTAASASQFRLNASARWSTPLGDRAAFVMVLDAELAPQALAAQVKLDPHLPPLAAWTAGLRLGASADLL